MSEISASSFAWAPGHGPHGAALARLIEAFPKPKKPMGEAWFLAPERKMYSELLGDLDTVSDDYVLDAVRQTIGPSCFGPHDEWTEWFHYLFPRLLQRDWGQTVYDPAELIITAFIAQHPDTDAVMPYNEFTLDALLTLGQYIMSAHCWPAGVLHASRCLGKFKRVDGTFGWYDADGLLSASLFLCLKYLPTESVKPWFESVLSIPNAFWLEQVIVWLIGAHPLLTGAIDQPSQLPEDGPCHIGWDGSYSLDGHYTGVFEPPIVRTPFLTDANKSAAVETVLSFDLKEFLLEWQTNPLLEELAAETAGLPERFQELYARSSISL